MIMASLDPELIELIKALARAAVSRDRARRKQSRRPQAPNEETRSFPSRGDGGDDAHDHIRKVQQPTPKRAVD